MEKGAFPVAHARLLSGMPGIIGQSLKPPICGLPASIFNLQCDECNVGKSGNIKAYRKGLVEKYGESAVLELDNDNRIHRWAIEELEAIRLQAYADLRALKKSQEAA